MRNKTIQNRTGIFLVTILCMLHSIVHYFTSYTWIFLLLRWGQFGPHEENERHVYTVLWNLNVTFAFKAANTWRQIVEISKILFNHVSYGKYWLSMVGWGLKREGIQVMSPFAALPQKRAKCPLPVFPTAFFVSRRLNKVKFCALSQASLKRSVLTCWLLLWAQFICLNIHICQHVTVKISRVTSTF